MPYTVESRKKGFNAEQMEPPFRFQDLPGEVRNEIYKIVADYKIEETDSRAYLAEPGKGGAGRFRSHLFNPLTPKEDRYLIIMQPGLFLTCKQIRNEGLPFFFQRRDFSFDLDGRCHEYHKFGSEGFTAWFEAIGKFGQHNVHHLCFHNPPPKTTRRRKRIFRRLSEKTTVRYSAGSLCQSELWEIASHYHSKDPDKMPVILTLAGIESFADLESQSPLLQRSRKPLELIFEPGYDWFGPELHEQTYLRDERHRIEAAGRM